MRLYQFIHKKKNIKYKRKYSNQNLEGSPFESRTGPPKSQDRPCPVPPEYWMLTSFLPIHPGLQNLSSAYFFDWKTTN